MLSWHAAVAAACESGFYQVMCPGPLGRRSVGSLPGGSDARVGRSDSLASAGSLPETPSHGASCTSPGCLVAPLVE